ncbi:hypothetical protein EYF80_044432 [Liparis tanakae]|uniref:Uncharacterized protein n=1 Tax=Liparis tanakae TaxID=230148 RepID=A0A4Z2FVV2_9TELE|nr:hypothetical protein EYF80_044432 [Liparis tanakae]
MHPGRIEAEEDRRRKAESGGHRKKSGDGDRKYERRAENETLTASRARPATERPEELKERENHERDETERTLHTASYTPRGQRKHRCSCSRSRGEGTEEHRFLTSGAYELSSMYRDRPKSPSITQSTEETNTLRAAMSLQICERRAELVGEQNERGQIQIVLPHLKEGT